MTSRAPVALLCTSHAPLMLRDPENVQGPGFRAAFAQARAFVQQFDPELVVFFGTEHRRTLTDIVAPFTVFCTARGFGDFKTSDGGYAIPEDRALALVAALDAAGIDAANGEEAKLDHGFGLTWGELLGANDALPVLPILINSANPPLPGIHRVRALGEAVRAFILTLEGRVLVLASGGLSHSPSTLTREYAKLPEEQRAYRPPDYIASAGKKINPAWDADFLAAVRANDWPALERLTIDDIERAGPGANEVRVWLAALAAAQPSSLQTVYEAVPDWITGMGVAFGPLEANR